MVLAWYGAEGDTSLSFIYAHVHQQKDNTHPLVLCAVAVSLWVSFTSGCTAELWWCCTLLESCCFYFASQGGYRWWNLRLSCCTCPSLQTACQKAQKHVRSPTGLWHCHDAKWAANSMISSMKKVQLRGVWNEVMGHVPQHWPKGIAHFLAKRWIGAMYPSSACILEWSSSLSSVVFIFMILIITKGKGNNCYNLNSMEQKYSELPVREIFTYCQKLNKNRRKNVFLFY